MAWTQRHDPLPSDWKTRRRQTATRAGWRCEAPLEMGARCPEPGTDCDHIINARSAEGQAMGDAVHGLRNLQWLCKEHHGTKTQAEARAAKAYRAMTGGGMRHPGDRNHPYHRAHR